MRYYIAGFILGIIAHAILPAYAFQITAIFAAVVSVTLYVWDWWDNR